MESLSAAAKKHVVPMTGAFSDIMKATKSEQELAVVHEELGNKYKIMFALQAAATATVPLSGLTGDDLKVVNEYLGKECGSVLDIMDCHKSINELQIAGKKVEIYFYDQC